MRNGASAEKVEAALGDYKKSSLFSPREKLALELCERMTYSDQRVTDQFFDQLKQHFSEEELGGVGANVAIKNFREKVNPVFALEGQGFWPLPAVKEVAAKAAGKFHE